MKRGLLRVALPLGGALAACLLLEAAVRILDVPPDPLAPLPIPDYRLSANPVLAYEYRPGYRSTEEPFDLDHQGFAINGAGFRDREYRERKPEGGYRVVVLGDSTTAGNGVALEATYAKRLEALLNARPGPGRRYEVLNMGVGGYQTLQEVETLRTKGLRYEPDLVLLAVNLTDFFPESDGGVYERLLRENRLSGADPAGALALRLVRVSRLAFVAYHRLGLAGSSHARDYAERVLRGRTPVRAGFEMLSGLQREHGFAARVLVLPEFGSPFSRYGSRVFHRDVQRAAAGLPGLAVVDLLPGFARLDDDAGRFSYDGIHLNEEGHRALAEMLLPLVLEAARNSV